MADIIKGFAIAIFCIYALLAIPFKSFTYPFIVMAAIPFGIVGAFSTFFNRPKTTDIIILFMLACTRRAWGWYLSTSGHFTRSLLEKNQAV